MSDADTDIKRMQEDLEKELNNIKQNDFINNFVNYIKSIKFPKFRIKIPEIDKPPRWLIIMIAIIIEIVLLFFVLWLFDDRTVFNSDYMAKRYSYSSTNDLHWGWFHKGVAITSIMGGIALFISILTEFAAYDKKGRAFYKFYR